MKSRRAGRLKGGLSGAEADELHSEVEGERGSEGWGGVAIWRRLAEKKLLARYWMP